MRLALIGDIHHYRLDLKWRDLFSKRVLGQTNLWLNRRHRFNHGILAPLLDRVAAVEPTHIVLTGDVTTTSLDNEFLDVARYLKPLSDRYPTLLVPGNHDRYTFASKRSRRIERLMEHLLPRAFPHFSSLGSRWYLLGLDGARPRVFDARGQLGEVQLQRTAEHLSALREGDGLVVACHYPLGSPPDALPVTPDHQLAEARALTRMLHDCPARIVYLHGHIHRPWAWSPTNGRHRGFTCINAGAPCMTSPIYPLGQGFWQIDLPDDPTAELGLVHHLPRLHPDDAEGNGRLNRRRRKMLTMPGPEDWEMKLVL